MHHLLPALRRRAGLAAVGTALCLLAVSSGCASDPPLPAAGSIDADKFLYERGVKELQEKHWLRAREYFRRLVDTYPGSTFRADAKLGIGDAYLGEGRVDSNILAANEFREFLTFFPLNARADYAQYKLAVAHVRQMLGPRRDQTATKEALRELEKFLQNYPTSALRPEVEKLLREARDRLSESEYLIGLSNYNLRAYGGAIGRFNDLLKADPGYTHRDAVYYHLAESILKLLPSAVPAAKAQLTAEAVGHYERIVAEFKESEYLERAKTRIAELKR